MTITNMPTDKITNVTKITTDKIELLQKYQLLQR